MSVPSAIGTRVSVSPRVEPGTSADASPALSPDVNANPAT